MKKSRKTLFLAGAALGAGLIAGSRLGREPEKAAHKVAGTRILRTPEERFSDLPDFPFAPQYVPVDEMRMHYVDEGPQDGEVVLMLHGEPSWSYLYRKMIPIFAAAGYRAIAPDLIGFGRSDKPADRDFYTYARHVEWVRQFIEQLELRQITLICQDWGSLIGLRLVGEHPERFARVVAANAALPTGDGASSPAFKLWRAFSQLTPVFPAALIVQAGTVHTLTGAEMAAYNAPFPSAAYQAGARVFPSLVPTKPNYPAAAANRRAWEALGHFDKPFLTVFGAKDPILGRGDRLLQRQIPGAEGQPHRRLDAGHFIQEDCGEQLAQITLEFIAANPITLSHQNGRK